MNRNGSTNEMSRAVNSGLRPHVRLQLDKRSVVRAGDEQCNAPPFVVPTGGTCRASRSKSGADDDTTRKQVIRMLVTVIVLFAVCWGPALIDNVLVAFGMLDRLNIGHLKPMRQAFALMTYVNSCMNPVVYFFMSRNFRQTFKDTLCSGKRFFRRHRQGAPYWETDAIVSTTVGPNEFTSLRDQKSRPPCSRLSSNQ